MNFRFSFFKFGVMGRIIVNLGLDMVYKFDKFVKFEGKDIDICVLLFLFLKKL